MSHRNINNRSFREVLENIKTDFCVAMNGPPTFVDIEYLDGTRMQVNKADVKLLISKNNEHKRKYVHYWTPAGDSGPSDFSNMGSLKKFKASPINANQRGLYYCKIVETPQPIEMCTDDPIEPTFFKPEVVLDCDTTESNHSENVCNDTATAWDTTEQQALGK